MPPVDSSPQPFTVRTDQAVLDDLGDRLRRTRWTDQIPGTGWEYGTDLAYLRDLCEYWGDGFDWRAAEARINRWPHVLTTVDGTPIHAIHARSPHPGAVPLLLIHGWPGSVIEFLDVIDRLADPPAYGGDPAEAFHVVCPSLPGYGWSGPTREGGWHIRRVADALVELMARLGYPRFAAQGGDWGGIAASLLGAHHPDRLLAIHLNLVLAPPPDEAMMAALSAAERAALERVVRFTQTETGYQAIQGTKPQTLAHGLADSPAGLAGWIVEKFRAWSDCDGDVEKAISRDDLLTNITTYWVTGTIGSSVRLYRESMRAGLFGPPDRPVTVPTGVAVFPREIVTPPRRCVEAHYDLRYWSELPRGGHFAALEQPELFAEDVRAFFRLLRDGAHEIG
ncbi:putative hydrolase or acyltransferase of alpha/beta superfamily [Frankia torreyi]|uniref:Putative hydrolase or acyltransferase of alpha/beta superfamily n=2 Tax=Frankia TaxID=1854 RepID=A0A0D8B7M7_9ACTN|nr:MULTISPECIES: epoxide hydrolase family protein [Frankia]KJE19934.1 putative hydrolase or acyltransferase of alpha/beta superfamily [Frankia torreyi]